MKSYIFNYNNYILIDLDKEEEELKLENKILMITKEQRKEKCSLCGGRPTNSIVKEKYILFPEILIVIIQGTKFDKFNLSENINIFQNNNKDKLYSLNCFIENDKNEVYYVDKNEWFKYSESNLVENGNDYIQRNPVLLFYKLMEKNYNTTINYGKNNNIKNFGDSNMNEKNINIHKNNYNDKQNEFDMTSQVKNMKINTNNSMNSNIKKFRCQNIHY